MRASEKAYQSLHEDIVSFRIAPGTVLGEVDLSERLNVSRTPIREALSRLIAEGLAAPKGGRGVVVSEISVADVRSLYELRQTLESAAAGLAAQRGEPAVFTELAANFARAQQSVTTEGLDAYYSHTRDLDSAIESQCGNKFLAATLANLRPQLARMRRMAQQDPQRLAEAAAEHGAICRAIASGNAELARAATTVHLSNSEQHILNHLQTSQTETP